MAREPSLKERVAVLEERLKLFEPLPEHKLALADSTARLRCAKEETRRAERFMWIVTAVSLTVMFVVNLFLVVYSAGH
jgi:hypothetical protein